MGLSKHEPSQIRFSDPSGYARPGEWTDDGIVADGKRTVWMVTTLSDRTAEDSSASTRSPADDYSPVTYVVAWCF